VCGWGRAPSGEGSRSVTEKKGKKTAANEGKGNFGDRESFGAQGVIHRGQVANGGGDSPIAYGGSDQKTKEVRRGGSKQMPESLEGKKKKASCEKRKNLSGAKALTPKGPSKRHGTK